ncbi:MAG: hypothetical protein ACYTFA_02910 [Planctomycetota bacterium]|jgi:hypothetical protein
MANSEWRIDVSRVFFAIRYSTFAILCPCDGRADPTTTVRRIGTVITAR